MNWWGRYMTLEEQLRAQGGDWNIGGIDRAAELADLLRRKGVTSLDGLKFKSVEKDRDVPGSWSGGEVEHWNAPTTEKYKANTLMFGDKSVGFLGDYNNDGSYGNKSQSILKGADGSMLGWSSRGDGAVGYHVEVGPDGKVKIAPHWGDTSDKKKLIEAAMVLGTPAAIWAASGGLAAAGANAGGVAGGAAGAAPSAGAYGAGLGAETAAGLVAPGAAGSGGAALAAPGAFTPGGLLATGAAGAAAASGAPSAGVYGEGLTAETAAGLVSPNAAGSGGALLTAPGAAGALSGLPSWLPKGLGSVWELVKDNPKLVGALAGGLLGGIGAEAGKEDEPAPYTGPMPTITRGNFAPSAMSGYKPMQAPQYGNGLLQAPQGSGGLGRYMGILRG